jgi:hypothetical protein
MQSIATLLAGFGLACIVIPCGVVYALYRMDRNCYTNEPMILDQAKQFEAETFATVDQ